jgi:hypothetical protein
MAEQTALDGPTLPSRLSLGLNKVTSSRTLVALGTVLLASAASLGMAQAEPISFKVPLSGGQEVPPVFPAGAGTAELTYDSATRVLTWTVAYRALSSPVTMAQIHGPAQPSKNAPSVLSLVKPGSPMESPINGQATLTPDQAKPFASGEWYINIATQNHTDGEIRGQILTPFPHTDDTRRGQRSGRSKH